MPFSRNDFVAWRLCIKTCALPQHKETQPMINIIATPLLLLSGRTVKQSNHPSGLKSGRSNAVKVLLPVLQPICH